MRNTTRNVAAIVLLLMQCGVAAGQTAPPPESCVGKFVGSWTVHIYATGQTYPSEVFADGTSRVTCFMCSSAGHWTCEGNKSHIFIPGRPAFSTTLSADGTRQDWENGYSIRKGPPPAAALGAVLAGICSAVVSRDASDFEKKAQYAEKVLRKESNYNNWAIVDYDFGQAHDLWKSCDAAKAAKAKDEQNRAKKFFDDWMHAPAPDSSKKCADAKDYLDKFKGGMGGDQWVNDQLAQMHCQ